jgi:uncharacterized phage-associated protein
MAKNKTTTPKMQTRAQDDKLKEAILLICTRSEGDESFGAIKLNKLLFMADFIAYQKFGKPITGQEYFRLPLGPAPKRMKYIVEAMRRNGELAIRETDYYGRKQNRAFALREPSVGKFTSEEIDLLDRVIQRWRGVSGTTISEVSHSFGGWIYAKEKETIPYEVALVGARKPTPSEIAQGASLQEEASRALAHG